MTSDELAAPSFKPLLVRHRIGVWRCLLFGILAALVTGSPASASPWLTSAITLVAIACVTFALVGRLWCAVYVSGRKGTSLVTAGPYSMCRHPLYVCNFVGIVGLGAFTGSFLVLGLLASAFALLYPAVIKAEEQLMLDRFPEYAEYARTTPAFFPRLDLYRTPAEWTVDVRAFLRNVADSIWFPLSTMVIVGIRHAHTMDLLPELLILP